MARSKVDSLPFAATRFINHSIFRYYYAFGNTPAEDLLEHVPDDIESPSVLQLGCGDIRSCLYTIWKNFDEHCGHGNFKGVTFHLNDYCAAVLARNVLFLHLIKKLSDIPSQNSLEVKKMVCAIWNIWFCHDLQQSQVVLLKESLLELSTFFKDPGSRSKSSNPQLRVGLVEEHTLHEIRSVFKMWLKMLKLSPSKVRNLKRQRNEAVQERPSLVTTFELYLFQATQSLNDSAKKVKMRSVIEQEITSYIETGNAHPEALFGLRAEYVKANSFLNPTLFEKEDQYTLHYSSLPYECFTHCLPMTTTNITFPNETLIVDQKCFVNTPLHANSLQQFTLWLLSTAKYLAQASSSSQQISQNEPKISFLLNFSDAIAAAVELSYKDGLLFDVIHASNLIDHLTTLSVIVSSIPLLKLSTGVLLTSTFHYRSDRKTSNLCEFMEMTLGFKMENLCMFGIRCIGYEGVYKGDGLLCPTPAFQLPFQQSFGTKDKLPRSLIWNSLASTPLCLPLLERDLAITHALYSCIKSSAYCIFQIRESGLSAVGACTQSSMKMVYLFLRQLSCDSPVNDFRFWEGLCYHLKQDSQLRPFLMHLQSQAFLMNIHMHIAVDQKDCPLCNAIPMEQYFQRFQVEFKHNYRIPHSSPITLICLHPKTISNLSHLDLIHNNLPPEVFLLDSSPTFSIRPGVLVSDIVIPRSALASDVADYSVSVFFHNFELFSYNGDIVSTVPLEEVTTIDLNYKTQQSSFYSQPNPSSSFGKLILLEYVGNVYNIDISLSEEVLSNLMEKTPLSSEKISNTEIKISCKNLSFPLKFNMPVNYNKLSIKYSKKRKLVMIEAPCKPFQSEDHLLLYFSTPHNNVALPEVSFKNYKTMFEQAAKTQLTSVQKTTSVDPLLNVGKVFASMFQSHESTFFLTMKKPANKLLYGLINVHKRCLDVQNQTVALDLSYCIKKDGTISREKYSELGNPCEIEVDKDELDFIENVLCLFYKRTRKSSKIPCPRIMAGCCPSITDVPSNGCDGFHRALVYHLSSSNVYNDDFGQKLDPSFTTHHGTSTTNSTSNGSTAATSIPKPLRQDAAAERAVCSFCKKEQENLHACSRCHIAKYCGKDCQTKDWPNHKYRCKKSDAT